MEKDKKIYILRAVKLDLIGQNRKEFNNLITVTAYFTNLKELYDNFESESIQSYSTVAARIKRDNFYRIRESNYFFGKSFERFNEITIAKALANKIYYTETTISLSDLLLKEASRISQDGVKIFEKQ